MDELEQLGVVGPHQGAKPRDVLVTYKEWEIIYNELPAEKETVIDDDSHDNDYSVLSDAEIRKMIAETPSVSEIYKTKFGIDIDYSDDGFFIDKLENSIFPNFDLYNYFDFVAGAMMNDVRSKKRILFAMLWKTVIFPINPRRS